MSNLLSYRLKSLFILFFIAGFNTTSYSQCVNIITNIAGNLTFGYAGDLGPATDANMKDGRGIVMDASGNIYIADFSNNVVRKVSPAGIITHFAGGGAGLDGTLAKTAALHRPYGLAIDATGNVYISEYINNKIRKVSTSGIITTLASGGTLNRPAGMCFDAAGNLYVANENSFQVKKVTSGGVVSNYAGTGVSGFFGDGGAATAAQLAKPTGVAMDRSGNLYVSCWDDHRVRKISSSGIITTVAGKGTAGFTGDGAAATAAELNEPYDVAVDTADNLYIADANNYRVRKVNVTTGIITTIAGTGSITYNGNNIPATAANVKPKEVYFDGNNNLYLADVANYNVRRVTLTPVSSVITGTSNVCAGATITLSDTTGGGAGIWSSSSTSIATAGSTGIITGVSAGTTTISYTLAVVCGTVLATKTITVNALPVVAGITGASAVCATYTVNLSDVTASGIWSSAVTTVATVGTSGIVSGVLAGTSTISYSVTNMCGTTTMTKSITVNPLPASISGFDYFRCPGGGITTYTDATALGRWSSSNTSVGVIGSSSGIVTAMSIGTTTISYTIIATGCYDTKVIKNVVVPTSITGKIPVCAGDTALLKWLPGCSWSSNILSHATIDSVTGIVTGIAPGPTTITATLGPGCSAGGAYSVIASPVPITGPTGVCIGNTTTLASSSGGLWTSGSTTVATVGTTSGIVSGVAAGTSVITCSFSGMCPQTHVVTVAAPPTTGPIMGPPDVCVGSYITLSNAISGGTWSGLMPSIATVGSISGTVTGVAAGTLFVTYQIPVSCGTVRATRSVTVNPLPDAGIISGPSSVCVAATIVLSDLVAGGVWSTSNSNATVLAGTVTGMAAGTVTISYSVTNMCGTDVAMKTLTINPLPDAGVITGGTTVCVAAVITLTDAAPGGVWKSSITGVATVTTSGLVSGIAYGVTTISYTVTNGCGSATATATVNVNPLPAPGTISGSASVCVGSTTALAGVSSGGVWSSSTPGSASVDAAGVVTGAAIGTATISYTLTNSCGTAYATYPVTVNPMPDAGVISGADSVCVYWFPVTLSSTITGGSWISGNTYATVDGSGVVTGVLPGTAEILYIVSNSCGSDTSEHLMTTVFCPDDVKTVKTNTDELLSVFPNPGNGTFSLILPSATEASAQVTIMNITGQEVGRFTIQTNKPNEVRLDVAPGIYILSATALNKTYRTKIISQ